MCVCACVLARARACVCVCVRAREREHAHIIVCFSMHASSLNKRFFNKKSKLIQLILESSERLLELNSHSIPF